MLVNRLLIAYRNFKKNRGFVLINILGMGIAIAHCIVSFFAYEYDSTFDGLHRNGGLIYRVSSITEFDNSLTRHGIAPFPLGEIVQETFQDIDGSTRFLASWSNFKRDNEIFQSNMTYVDPGFFEMFTFDFIEGDLSTLKDNSTVFLSKEMAIRLFGSPQAALDKSITQVYGNQLKELKVGGVYVDPPMNTSFYRMGGSSYVNFENALDEYVDINSDDWAAESTLFLQINNKSQLSNIYQQLQKYVKNSNEKREDVKVKEYVLEPFVSMAHQDRRDDVHSETWKAPPISAVIGSMVMGVLILLIACFNLTNTFISIASRRLKEIGIRKVMGSTQNYLIVQFLGETMIVCVLASLLGLFISDLIVRGWNSMWQYFQLTPHYFDSPGFIIFFIGVIVISCILAGGYPAFYISKFGPASILRGRVRFGGTNYFTRTLLAIQFANSLVAVVCAIGFVQNAWYQRNFDLGFNVQGSIVAWVNDRNEYEVYYNALHANPKILSLAGAKSGVFSNHKNEPVKYESKQLGVDIIEVGDNYLQVMGLQLIQGRDFLRDSETDQSESIIITQKLANSFGWDHPIGKELVWKDSVKLFVIGVIKDVYTQGLWHEMEPMMIRYVLPKDYNQIVVSAKGEDVFSVNTFMNKEWDQLFPFRVYNGRVLVDDIKQVTEVNNNIVYTFTVTGLIALLLSTTGLYSLVSLNVIRRMKEIGVRKVFGASVSNIAKIINKEFIIILIAASMIGSLGGYTMANFIMSSIWKYNHGLDIVTIMLSLAILFTISFASIGYKVYLTAAANPVNALKDD